MPLKPSTVVDDESCEFGELRVSCDRTRNTSRGTKAGPGTGPRGTGSRMPAPESKQGIQADGDDDVRADGMARLADGEEEGGGVRRQ